MEASQLGISTFQFITIIIALFTSITTLVIYFHRTGVANAKSIGILEGVLLKESKLCCKEKKDKKEKKIKVK